MTISARRLAALSLTMAAIAPTLATAQPVVRAPAGTVRGTEAGGERIFRGIPYAQPPVGSMRWRAPEPLAVWRGVRDATNFGPACMQTPYAPGSLYAETYSGMSEDCLTLNVWAPKNAKNAPVFVFVHGGSLVRGSSQESVYDGAALAKRGIVVITINYRLGVLGYLAHPGLSAESPQGISGNYGLLDQIASLKWVQRNIAAFGGNPKQVTIAGESAGALSMMYLLASPQARGLFARAIVESSSFGSTPALKTQDNGMPSAESAGVRFATAVGAKNIADLRALDSQAIIAAAVKGQFVPTAAIDGRVLTRQLVDTFDRGEQARVPVLTGFNSGEIRTLRAFLPPPVTDPAAYEAAIRARYGELADTFLGFYPSSDIAESMLATTRDAIFGWTSQRLVRNQTAIDQPSYLYFFDHTSPAAEAAGLHGFHASELPYVFGTLDRTPPRWPAIPQTPAEWKYSAAMTDYWASFVKTGRPVAVGAPLWRPFGSGGAYMRFADPIAASAHLFDDRYKLHEQMTCRRRAAGLPWALNVGVASPLPMPPKGKCA